MIVGNRHNRTVFNDLAKLHSPHQPTGSVLGVVVSLIAREEKHIGILLLEIGNHRIAISTILIRIAGKRANNDVVLVMRIAANEAFENRALPVPHPIRNTFSLVPTFQSEVSRPTEFVNRSRRDFLPFAADLKFETSQASLVGTQRK